MEQRQSLWEHSKYFGCWTLKVNRVLSCLSRNNNCNFLFSWMQLVQQNSVS